MIDFFNTSSSNCIVKFGYFNQVFFNGKRKTTVKQKWNQTLKKNDHIRISFQNCFFLCLCNHCHIYFKWINRCGTSYIFFDRLWTFHLPKYRVIVLYQNPHRFSVLLLRSFWLRFSTFWVYNSLPGRMVNFSAFIGSIYPACWSAGGILFPTYLFRGEVPLRDFLQFKL